MKKILKLIAFSAILLSLVGGFFSCKEDIDIDPQKAIIGKWKLVKLTVPMMGVSYNYSNYNIVYDFKANGVLTVSGKIDQIDWYGGYEVGEYPYSVGNFEYGHNLKIGNYEFWWVRISSKTLVMDDSPVDGPICYLVKI